MLFHFISTNILLHSQIAMAFTSILRYLIYVSYLILVMSVLSEQQNPTCATGAEMQVITQIDWPGNDADHRTLMNQTACGQLYLQNCSCTVAIYANLDGVGNCWIKAMPLGTSNQDKSRTALVKVYNAVPTMPSTEKKEGKGLMVTGIILMVCSLVFAASLLLIWLYKSRPRLKSLQEHLKVNLVGLKAFTYQEIYTATGSFNHEIGRGAFGKVYKGVLSDGRAIAVKKLDDVLKQGEHQDGEKEFRTEMGTIGATHHKNLVQLYGFCDQGSNRILVYEYMPTGSLDRVLFKVRGNLDWELRVQIALETARGILYLHEECTTPILHCDIKPQNILMDENYHAKIGDFGIAKLIGAEQTRTFTVARGTIGYIAPEWQKSMAVTVKVDVYSFGVVLLEIICCRKMFELHVPEDEMILCDWVYDCFKYGKLVKLVEQQECSGVDAAQLEIMVLVGLWCIQEDLSLRPSINKVVQMLEGTIEIRVPPHPASSSRVSAL
ncbi:G-type lectin S-receptor-like serine/threonine-protein kinase LECRK4 [Cryptomeria japonica]|uniref:G-type lectin S-receptor-like serine/threonine-protein kinase LECRK4 n=1 Tax=Cryptomeria japonica TaxID=3369 RepID=UPI0027D9D66C|nr:G-type lectin S-receptor-like serine/threonine-protein kinase LECRK4 [Cryptomeria japonica]